MNQSGTLTEVAIAEMRRTLHASPDNWKESPGLMKMINYTAIQQVRQPRIDLACDFFRALQGLVMRFAEGAYGVSAIGYGIRASLNFGKLSLFLDLDPEY
jgi:hypothetical protein